MVPLQAGEDARQVSVCLFVSRVRQCREGKGGKLTELLLDDFEDLFLVELLGEALDRGQGLTSIALWR